MKPDPKWARQLANLSDPTDADGEINLKATFLELERLARAVNTGCMCPHCRALRDFLGEDHD
jgi:hypothetical protein